MSNTSDADQAPEKAPQDDQENDATHSETANSDGRSSDTELTEEELAGVAGGNQDGLLKPGRLVGTAVPMGCNIPHIGLAGLFGDALIP